MGTNGSSVRISKRFCTTALSFVLGFFLSSISLDLENAQAAPQGGVVSAGSATISNVGNTTTINQTSPDNVINWSSYNVGAQESVIYNQPNALSTSLNRISDINPSQIYGSIKANGQIFLINPNGILFGSSAQVNVGSLFASTLGIGDADFMNKNYNFAAVPGAYGTIVNQGTINAATGGYVALVGDQVENSRTISADAGQIFLGAGRAVTMAFDADGLLQFKINAPTLANNNSDPLKAAVTNSGDLTANAGKVVMSGQAAAGIFTNVVNNTGVVEANRIQNVGGDIQLLGDGGDVITSGKLKATGHQGTGGKVYVLGNRLGLLGNGLIDVSGDLGGGEILLGGDAHGANPDIQNADVTVVASGAALHADALTNGDGGKIVVWANKYNQFDGSLTAKGGSESGNGGFAEISSPKHLVYAGSVDLTAEHGKWGTLLFDPDMIIIEAGSGTGDDGNSTFLSGNDGLGTIDASDATTPFHIFQSEIEGTAADIVLRADTSITATNDNGPWSAAGLTLMPGESLKLYTDNGASSGNVDLTLMNKITTTAGGGLFISTDTSENTSNFSNILLPNLNIGGTVSVTTENGSISLADVTSVGGQQYYAGGGKINLHSTYVTTGSSAPINFNSPVALIGDTTVTTKDGDITFSSAIDSGGFGIKNLIVNAGNFTTSGVGVFDPTVGSVSLGSVGFVNVVGVVDVTAAHNIDASFVFTTGMQTYKGDVSKNGDATINLGALVSAFTKGITTGDGLDDAISLDQDFGGGNVAITTGTGSTQVTLGYISKNLGLLTDLITVTGSGLGRTDLVLNDQNGVASPTYTIDTISGGHDFIGNGANVDWGNLHSVTLNGADADYYLNSTNTNLILNLANGNNDVYIGRSSIPLNSFENLDEIGGTVTINGGVGTSNMTLDDSLNTVSRTWTFDNTPEILLSGAAGSIFYNDKITSLTALGGSNRDIFNVNPSSTTALNIYANDPVSSSGTGDQLNYDGLGLATTLSQFGLYGHDGTFTSTYKTVNYFSVEQLSVSNIPVFEFIGTHGDIIINATAPDDGSVSFNGGPFIAYNNVHGFDFYESGAGSSLTINHLFDGMVNFDQNIEFDNAGGGLSLTINGGKADSSAYEFLNAHDGSIDILGTGHTHINYTGLTSILDKMTVAFRTFNYSIPGVKTTTLSGGAALSDDLSDIVSSGAEKVTFKDPTVSLTVNTTNGHDIVNVAGLDSAFTADLNIYGDSAYVDTVNFTGNLDINSGAITVGTTSNDIRDINLPAFVVEAGGTIDLHAEHQIANASFLSSTGGNINLTTTDTLGGDISNLVTGVIHADQNINMSAGRDVNNAGGLQAADDSVTMTAGRDINNPGVITANQDVSMTAGRDITTSGNITATNGDASLIASNNLILFEPVITAANDVLLQATNGAINATPGGIFTSIVADTMSANANLGIFGLYTDVNTLAAHSNAGSIMITNDGDLTVGTVDSIVGVTLDSGTDINLTVNKGGSLTVNSPIEDAGLGNVTLVVDNMLNNNSLIKADFGQVIIRAGSDVNLNPFSSVQAPNGIVSILTNGVINGSFGLSPDQIVAPQTALVASTGINGLWTEVGTLAAQSDTGGIRIDNTGALIIGKVNGAFGTVTGVTLGSSALGDINITTHSPLTINNDVRNLGAGDVSLNATGSGGNLTNNAIVIASNGDVTLGADNDVVNNVSGTVLAHQELMVTAGHDILNVLGAMFSEVNDTSLTAGHDIQNTGIIATQPSGNVNLTAGNDVSNSGNGLDTGIIIANNGNLNIDAGNDVTNKALMSAAFSLSVTAGHDVTNRAAMGAENFDVTLDVGNDLSNTGGIVALSGNLTATVGHNVLNSDLGNGGGVMQAINMAVDAGHDILWSGAASTLKATNQASLLAGGSIDGSASANTGEVVADQLDMTAGIDIDVNTQVNTLAAQSTGGSITVNNTGALTVGSIFGAFDFVDGVTLANGNPGNVGSIAINAMSPLTVNSDVHNFGMGNVVLSASDNLTNNVNIEADNGDVGLLSTGGNIVLSNGSVVNASNAVALQANLGMIDGSAATSSSIIADQLAMTAWMDINVVTQVNLLAAAEHSGSMTVFNTGALTIANINSVFGTVYGASLAAGNPTNHGNILITTHPSSGDSFTVASNVDNAGLGGQFLYTPGNMTINPNVLVGATDGGVVILWADGAFTNNGVLLTNKQLDIIAGGGINLLGETISGGITFLQTPVGVNMDVGGTSHGAPTFVSDASLSNVHAAELWLAPRGTLTLDGVTRAATANVLGLVNLQAANQLIFEGVSSEFARVNGSAPNGIIISNDLFIDTLADFYSFVTETPTGNVIGPVNFFGGEVHQ